MLYLLWSFLLRLLIDHNRLLISLEEAGVLLFHWEFARHNQSEHVSDKASNAVEKFMSEWNYIMHSQVYSMRKNNRWKCVVNLFEIIKHERYRKNMACSTPTDTCHYKLNKKRSYGKNCCGCYQLKDLFVSM